MSERASFIFGRALPIGVFGFLTAIQAQLAYAGVRHALLGNLDWGEAMYLLNRVLAVAFFSFLLAIYMLRGKAIASDHNPLAVVAALTGSFILYGLVLVPGQPRNTNLGILGLSDLCLACGMAWAIYSLSYLRFRFSIIPEARGLVMSGPYRVVRHPIYLGEIVAGFGLVLPTIASPHALVFGIFVGAQLLRTYYEERTLRTAFPQYEAYVQGTRRLIPFVL